MGAESLDLHTLFEAGGNDPASRQRVLDVVTRLADTGYLESRGSDFYLLTDKGRMATRWSVGTQTDSAPDGASGARGEWTWAKSRHLGLWSGRCPTRRSAQ